MHKMHGVTAILQQVNIFRVCYLYIYVNTHACRISDACVAKTVEQSDSITIFKVGPTNNSDATPMPYTKSAQIT